MLCLHHFEIIIISTTTTIIKRKHGERERKRKRIKKFIIFFVFILWFKRLGGWAEVTVQDEKGKKRITQINLILAHSISNGISLQFKILPTHKPFSSVCHHKNASKCICMWSCPSTFSKDYKMNKKRRKKIYQKSDFQTVNWFISFFSSLLLSFSSPLHVYECNRKEHFKVEKKKYYVFCVLFYTHTKILLSYRKLF